MEYAYLCRGTNCSGPYHPSNPIHDGYTGLIPAVDWLVLIPAIDWLVLIPAIDWLVLHDTGY